MKNVLILFALILFSFTTYTQPIEGKWKINTLITKAETKEYILHPINTTRWNYGNNLELKPDGTFESYYTAPCGNNCFTNTSGTYKIINATHLTLFLKKISKSGMCEGDSEPNKSMGVYSIHYEDGGIQLLKSTSLILNKESYNKIFIHQL